MRSAAIVVALLVSFGAHAQTLGKLEGPLRVLVSGSPGGPADSGIRLLVPALTADMPRIVVDNRPGAGGQAAGKLLMNSAPDGRTLMVGSSGSHVIAPLMSKNPPYDPVSDFTPIILITSNGLVLVANQKYSPNNFSELLAVAQKNRGGVNVGAAGATGELAIALLENMAAIKMNRIRWNGAGPTEVGVLSGEVEMALLPPVSSLGHIREGRLKGIGVTSSRRVELLPNLPTFQEQGVKGYTQDQLAERANTERSHISALERAEKGPALATIFSLAEGLGVPAGELIGLVEKRLKHQHK